jgi:Zn finger protein HypA/HybF involved in hydrogenase expression
MDYASFYVQCEKCFISRRGVFQYRPELKNGRIVFKCPSCGASEMQIILGGNNE